MRNIYIVAKGNDECEYTINLNISMDKTEKEIDSIINDEIGIIEYENDIIILEHSRTIYPPFKDN